MTSNGNDATPTGNKRPQPEGASTPASAKKRKLNDEAPQPAAGPRTLSSIASAIGNALGYGSQPKPSPVTNSAGAASSPAGAPKPRPAIKLAALKGTIWDTQEKPRLGSSPSKPSPRATPKSKATPKSSARKQQAASADSPSKPRGRPRKVPVPQPVEQAVQGEQEGADSADKLSGPEPGATPSSVQKQASTKRLWGGPAASPTPKSILTPSKNRVSTPKSVKFDKPADGDLFFEDLPTAKKPSTAKKPPKPQEPDIRCGLCAKAHSRPPNEIILCDNCDYAVHQECYGVREIPEGDWLCKGCAQDDVLETPMVVDSAPTPATKAADVPDIPNLDQHLRSLQRVLLDRCTGRRRIEMFGLQEVHEKAHQMIEQTVVAGEGNSMLLIGGRGSGKTTILENIIDDMSAEHKGAFHVVRLNGFIHTDDKLALKEIWRQLGKEMDVEDDLMGRTNYADTMASLLALLSHPSEILGTDDGVTSQSIIFIIDEFDLFAAHPRQTLLYNLFDVAQSRKAPIAVLGCTTKLNVVEMLEKRVKSRFSHRYVYLTLPKSLPGFWQVCKQGLLVEKKDAEREGIDMNLEGYAEFQTYWSSTIDKLYKQRSFQELLQYHYYTTKSPSAFFNDWILPLSSLSIADMSLEPPSTGNEATSVGAPDSRMHLLSTLSDLDLSLLIAAARLDIVAHTDNVNFAMAYDEYSALVGRQRVQSSASGMLAVGGGVRVWSRGVAGLAWERLISLGLLVPSGIGGKGLGHGGLEGRMWKVDVALEEIPLAVKLNGGLAKWCKEI